MDRQLRRRLLIGLNLFLGLSAVGGGLAMLAGWLRLPLSLLTGSAFSDYTVPAVLLVLAVGVSGLIAAWLTRARLGLGIVASAVAGAAITIYEIVEWNVIGFSWLLAIYVGIGVAILALVAWVQLAERPLHQPQRRRHALATSAL